MSFYEPINTVTPRVYSYTRFSTPEQAAGDSYRRQAEGAKRWLQAKNHERERQSLPLLTIDDRLKLSDLGVSAYRGANTEQDAGLGGFLTACREGLVVPGSYLLVESLDRVSRMTPRKVQRLLDDIVDAGVTIATLSDGQEYDSYRLDSDPTALLIALMVSWRAHEESKIKGQRLSAVWKEKRRDVRDGTSAKLTAKGPAWLCWTPDGWKEREGHSDSVRRIFSLTLAGQGENKIASTLNREGVSVMGRGKMWHRSTVSKILRNPAVIGHLIPGHMDYSSGRRVRVLEDPIPGVFPEVISRTDWQAVRALKDGRTRAVRGRGAAAPIANVFAGLARCPECGAAMTRVMKGSGVRAGKPKLVCTAAKVGKADHLYRSVPLGLLEAALVSSWQALVANVPAGDAGGHFDADYENLRAAIDATEQQYDEAEQRLVRNPSATTASQLRALGATLNSYRSDLSNIEQERAFMDHGIVSTLVETLFGCFEADGETLAEIDTAKTNATLRTLFEAVCVDYRTGLLRFQWKQGGESSIRYEWVE
ncbi:recombinase family protein [Qipengyuania psychrotolerans]|uniref:Recombinase family protein n=1 Tax=Qipengyuania psychrotolerans TaxID=2867238 RepID=A0ABX8ZCG8_9SPHN|nr:recombinase family protein [Qipengyuania psychrotolerans]QZD86682.1 recombinase family protein [Qipengyuania psychrotolerans]